MLPVLGSVHRGSLHLRNHELWVWVLNGLLETGLAPWESRTVGMGSFLDYGLTSSGPYILVDSSTLTVDIVDICHVHDRLQRRVQYSKIMVSRCDQWLT